MAPDQIARVVRLRVAAEIEDELATLLELAAQVAHLGDATGSAEVEALRPEALAFKVQRFYTGVETLLSRILRELDGDSPTGERWHQDLLAAAAVPIEGGRPEVVSKAGLAPLKALLGFRHLVWHNYQMDLDDGQMGEHAGRVALASSALQASLGVLVAWLKQH